MAATIHRFLNINDDWEDTVNWDSGKVPGSGGPGVDSVIIDGPASGVCQSLLRHLNRQGYATATLTLTANAGDGQQVTIRDRTYTFEAVFTDTANYVKIGASASDSLDNLIAAINNGSGEGTVYGTGTAIHAEVSAAAGTGDTMDITAKAHTFNGMYVTLSETLTNGSWNDTTMSKSGGSSLAVVDVRSNYDADIGSDGARLYANVTNFYIRSAGGTVYQGQTSGTTALTLDSDNRVNALVATGGYTTIEAKSGAARIGSGACTYLRVSYRTNPETDVRIEFTHKTATVSYVWANGGIIHANSELTYVYQLGPALIIYGVADNDFAAPALLLLGAGRFVDNIDNAAGGGSITEAIVGGGTLDASQTDGVKAINTLRRFRGCRLEESPTGYFDIVTDLTVGE